MPRTPIAARGGLRAVLTVAMLLAAASATRGSALKQSASFVPIAAPVQRPGPYDSKIDPALRLMVSSWNATQRLGASIGNDEAQRRLLDPTSFFHLLHEAGVNEPVAPVFVRLSEPEVARSLVAQGVRITAQVGDIAVAHVPVSRVGALASRHEILCLEMSGTSFELLDSSRVRSHVDEVYAGTGLDRAYQGSGVVVGVLDSGLDFTHPDFKTAGGATRLKGLYDFSFGANGREWSIGSIDSVTSTEYDGHGSGGHGTHVTGTAAGGGKLNTAYRGIAPLADIVFVKGTRDTASAIGFDNTDVFAGVQYIFDKARALGEPCVVNLSLGGQVGAHDGTSLYEQALDGLTHPGNIIVAAAGNSGREFIHAGYTVPPGTTYNEAKETAWVIFPGTTQSVVDAWYPASGTILFGVVVYSPGNLNTALAGTAAIAPGGSVNNQTITDGATNYGQVTIDATTTADPNNGKRRVFFALSNSPASAPASSYIWSIYAVGSGTFDMWMVNGGGFPPASYFGGLPSYFVPGDNSKSVGTPATAKKIISVGSYVTKVQWVDVNGATQTQPGATLDQISTFSSIGPSGDGRALPNLAAPGEAIVAPLAYTVAGFTAATDIVQGGGYFKEQGTSMASPHVTGTIALMLEKNPFLTPENARQLLQNSAVAPAFPDANVWGAGKLNALAAMLATPPSITCGPPSPFAKRSADCEQNAELAAGVLRVYPNPTAHAATLAFRLSSPERVDLMVYDLAGRRVRTLQSGFMSGGTQELVWDGTNDRGTRVTSGVYFARLWTPSHSAHERLVVIQ